jgi:hypothetical protein
VESWIEVNIVPTSERDARLLTETVPDLVHELFKDEIETWFFFWEPELRLRIRWRSADRSDEYRSRLATHLDAVRAAGRILDWYEGAHGRRRESYQGESETYGEEVWPSIQKDWMNGSELAVDLSRLRARGELSQPLAFHWSRHVHLITNQLFGTWDAEIELCLQQALGYLRHLRSAGSPPSEEMRRLVSELADEIDRGRSR